MAHQFKPVDRDAEMLLPHNMLDWVPESHAVRVVIGTVERIMTRDLIDRLVPPARQGSAAGPQRYDPVMLLTVWMYAYLRGVLSTRAVEDRCRYDATFRVACGRDIPDHSTFSRFRQHLFAQAGLAEDLFYQVLRVCACAGLGRLGVVAGDGVKIAANASKEASRTEAGLRRLAAQVISGAREAAAGDEASEPPLPGTDLLLAGDVVPPGPDRRSRAGRIAACLDDLAGERAAAGAQARQQGQAYLEALAAWHGGWSAPGRGRRRCAAAPGGEGDRGAAGRDRGVGGAPGRRPQGAGSPAPRRRGHRRGPQGPRPAGGPAGARRRRSGGRGQQPGAAAAAQRTPGCCRSAAAGSSRAITARTPRPMTG